MRLALSQAPLWSIRGRLISQTPVLAAAAEYAEARAAAEWCGARMLLARPPPMPPIRSRPWSTTTRVESVLEDQARPASWEGPVLLSLCLDGRSAALLQMGRVAEAVDDARRALAVAREVGSRVWRRAALACLGVAAWQVGDRDGALRIVRRRRVSRTSSPVGDRALSSFITMILTEVGDLPAPSRPARRAWSHAGTRGPLDEPSAASGGTRRSCTCGPAWCRERRAPRAAQTAPDRRADRGAQRPHDRPGLLRPAVRGHPAPGRGDHGVGGGVRAPWSGAAPHESRNPAEREELQRHAPGNDSGPPVPGRPKNAARP